MPNDAWNRPILKTYKKDIHQAYFVEGQSYQQIADRYGKSREAVRQFLNNHFPEEPVKGREFRQQRRQEDREKREAALEEAREKIAPVCVVCYSPVLRKTGGRGPNRTCSPYHSELWSKARFLLDPDLRERQRQSMARSILRYPNLHKPSSVDWAHRVIGGQPVNSGNRTHQDSQARQAYEEVLQIREGKKR